ncbi:hypothetical protein M8C21_004192, partial [Ambrosia artemisiifolia]
EMRQAGERIGFEVVTYCSTCFHQHFQARFYLGSFQNFNFFGLSAESVRWPTVGRYKVDVASFEALASPELQCCVFWSLTNRSSYHSRSKGWS